MSTNHAAPRPRKRRGGVIPIAVSASCSTPPGARPAMNAAAPTNDGSTSGRTSATRHTLDPGRSVRVVSQASAVPSTAVDMPTRNESCTVRHSGAGTSLRTSPRSPPSRSVRHTTNPAGPAKRVPMARPSARFGVTQLARPGRWHADRPAAGRVAEWARPASVIRCRLSGTRLIGTRSSGTRSGPDSINRRSRLR